MGDTVSSLTGKEYSDEPDPVTGLRPKEKACVQHSWSFVRKDLEESGIKLFLTFFKDHPQYQRYFPFKEVPYEELSTNKKLKSHALNVMNAISAIVDNINNNDVLIDLLQKNGQSHAKRKINEQAYWDLKDSTLKTLQEGLGTTYTKEVGEAWDKTLSVAFSVIIKTINEASTKQT